MRPILFVPLLLVPLVSVAGADVLTLNPSVPIGVQWVRDEFQGMFSIQAGYARELSRSVWVEGTCEAATSGPMEVLDGPTPSWNTLSGRVKFVHEWARVGRFGLVYGAGAGWAVIRGTLDWSSAELSSTAQRGEEPFDHHSPFLILDARLRSHFLEDRLFLELRPIEVSAGFEYRSFTPTFGAGWTF